jgi:preprotein translocase subunit SecE
MDDTKTITTGEKAATKFNLFEFFRETRREIAKVTWPTRRETILTTTIIVSVALLVGLFFFIIDSALGYAIGKILGMRG